MVSISGKKKGTRLDRLPNGWALMPLMEYFNSSTNETHKIMDEKYRELSKKVPKQVLKDAFGCRMESNFVCGTHVDFSMAASRTRRCQGLPLNGVLQCSPGVPDELVAALNFIEAYSGMVPIKQTIPLALALGLNSNEIQVLILS